MKLDLKKKLYNNIFRIRAVEEEIAKKYKTGKDGIMRCPIHLSSGQEAVAAAFSTITKKKDYAVGTHRGHAHYLAKVGNLDRMIAEIYGKKNGCSGGKGGSMHLIDLNVNFMGTTAIVGSSIPIGVGIALSIKIKKQKDISFVFLGDGAVESGVFYESLNFAAIKKLPVVFICENNLYSVYSPLKVRQPKKRNIAKLAASIGVDSSYCDGMDIMKVYKALKRTTDKVRTGKGPQFIEFSTYRWREHCGPHYDNDLGYRTKKEFNFWKNKDPFLKLKKHILKTSPQQKKILEKIEDDIIKEVDNSFKKAKKAKFPSKNTLFKDIYAQR
jgi:pyruvate dehydrogenase E1 component alpha subunit